MESSVLGVCSDAQRATLAMVRKTFTIMGRFNEASSDHDLEFYPAMQVPIFLRWTSTLLWAAWISAKRTCSCETSLQNTVGKGHVPSHADHPSLKTSGAQ